VLDRIKHFAVVFAQELVPGITQQQLDLAFSRALYSISAQDTSGHAQLELKFNHNCRWACRTHSKSSLSSARRSCNASNFAVLLSQVLGLFCTALAPPYTTRVFQGLSNPLQNAVPIAAATAAKALPCTRGESAQHSMLPSLATSTTHVCPSPTCRHMLCRFLGCVSQDCLLCKNNPHKTCGADDNFDEAYADNQVLRARCEAEIFVDLTNQVTGDVYSAPGVEVQVCVQQAVDDSAATAAAAAAAGQALRACSR
jgi:hypothetical protein